MRKVSTDEKQILNDQPLPFTKLLSYADGLDYTLMALASLGSTIHGLAQPLGYLLLGKAIDAFGNNIDDDIGMVKALKKVIPFVWYMAFATFPAGIIEVGGWMYASERQVARLRLAYLKAVLKQEIGAFDTELTNGKIITGISNHMGIIQDAIGEKVSLLTLFVVPMILMIGATYTKKMNSISATKTAYLAEATVMVEQTVSQIRTVFAFVGESSAIKSFSECMQRQLIISKGEALIKGVGTGVFQTVTFCSWALIVWIGALVVVAKRAQGGDVIAAVMSILFGAISITYAAPDMQIFNQARAAGKEVFEVIERKSLISYDSKGAMLAKIHGNIEIREVLIDNHNVKDLDIKFLRKNIGAVSQEPALFAGTIKDNMKVGNKDADDERIQSAATLANAHTFISQLPNQYSTDNISAEGESSSAHPTKETERIDQQVSEQLDQLDKPIESNKILKDAPKQEDQQDGSVKKDIFFRIWFGLNSQEFVKIGVGSFAAAFSGISKPVFGFFIITIGVAYYKHGAKEKVGWYSLLFSAIGVLSLFSHTLQHYFYGVIGEKAMTNLRQALYSAVLRNELAWYDKPENSVGSLTSRIINETSTVKTIISDRMAVIVQCISSILIATGVSMYVNWRMGLVAWAVMPCHFIGGLIQAKSAKGFSGDTAAAHSELVALASESATNIKTVASFCHEEHILERAKLSLDGPLRKSLKQSVHYGFIQGVSLCLWNIAHAVALWYSTVLVEKKQASFEDGIRSYQIFSLTVPSITELWTLIPTVISAINVLTPVFQALDRQTEIEPDEPENPPSEKIKGEIEIQSMK
ncbi:hypothetical protein L6452_04520 [Arctium lappa]|uniref:Uncharacterized protein n=1 Tax=Arctium lappa TaxID=4217 RepID=A0ACB9EEX2_ARCLA|nr:hypothetical protein L6452_04520 [Arctium lappa]